MNSGFEEWWERINRRITGVLLFLLAAAILAQVLHLNRTFKGYISRTDRLEGKSVEDSQLMISRGEIEISIENLSALRPLIFYINGEKVDTPAGKTIKLQVKNNDVVEVSGAEVEDTAVLKVTAVSDNVTVPELGKLIYVSNNLAMIARVRLK